MRHSRAQKLFSAALDRELSPRLRWRFEGHLEKCAGCRREFALFRLTHRLLGREEGAMSADFTDRLVGRLREERGQGISEQVRLSRHLRLAVGAAVLLLLFLWGDRMHVLPELRESYQEQQAGIWIP